MQTFIVKWTTGDTDTCYGRRDLNDLLAELGYTLDGNEVKKPDGTLAGRVTIKCS
jgi:hypothetical protein